jgi:hypothetical protein
MKDIKLKINESAWDDAKLKNRSDFEELTKTKAPKELIKILGEFSEHQDSITPIDLLRVVTAIYKDMK